MIQTQHLNEKQLVTNALHSVIGEESINHLSNLSEKTLDDLGAIKESVLRTALVLGYVQSGKTTAMTALMASAADRGYRIIIAILGSTNILLDQNSERIKNYLGIEKRSDYKWVCMPSPKGTRGSHEVSEWLEKKRTLFIPVLKNRVRIENLTQVLEDVPGISNTPALIIDDEADQASLNTEVRRGSESRVYAAIDSLRSCLPNHGFVQFTATPYAPLLLDSKDPLFPRIVEYLEPGKGYVGGREFFIDHEANTVRYIPSVDEQSTELPVQLPGTLREALWGFVVSTAVMMETVADCTPISMLVHSTHRNDIQSRYHHLISLELNKFKAIVEQVNAFHELPEFALSERNRLIELGAGDELEDFVVLERLRYVLNEVRLWLLNSATDIKNVNWNVSPVHLLVGGNKLDRGFTVEGLTFTYMNRPASVQVDTIEQRARAYGYRSEFLPFCRFFASARTVKMLREIVFTEYDLRASLQDSIDNGQSLEQWVGQIGLLLPSGSKPTRDNVVQNLSRQSLGWCQLRRPCLKRESIEKNNAICNAIGLFQAPLVRYGRMSFRTLEMDTKKAFSELLKRWCVESYSPDWRADRIIETFERVMHIQDSTSVMLMERDAEGSQPFPRERRWTEQEGFINLMQGSDAGEGGADWYPGDRYIGGIEADPTRLVIQVHRVRRRGIKEDLLTLAVHLGDRQIVSQGANS